MQRMAIANETHPRRSDALAMGLFGLTVGAFTLGLAQLGEIPERNHIGILVIVLVCSGLMPFLAGMAMLRDHEPLCGFALATYGLFWSTLCAAKLISENMAFQLNPILYGQLDVICFVCAVVMVYLLAYRSTTLCLLFLMIAATCFLTVLTSLGLVREIIPGIGHIVVGLMALYHALGSVSLAFTGRELVPLGPPLLPRRARAIQPVRQPGAGFPKG